MEPVSESDVRASFVNCTKGEVGRLSVPRDLADRRWEDLDFLGWSDASAPERAYLVVPHDDRLVGIAFRKSKGSERTQMCSVCRTTHTRGGVVLMTARKTGPAGKRGDSVGIYLCSDLACSLYARGKKRPSLGNRYREDLAEEDRIARVRENLDAFVGRVVAPS